jgi:uncharacterized membrane protein YuzA (DUF378 family)
MERNAEHEQGDVVQLARCAGQEGARADPLIPAPSKTEEPAAHEIAGEVLLGDGHLTAFPAVADLPQHGQHEVLQDALRAQPCESPVEDRACLIVVEAQQGLQQILQRGALDGLVLRREPRGLGRRHALREVLLHVTDPPLVLRRVQTEASVGARRTQEPVAPFPGAQQLRAHPRAPGELADAKAGHRASLTGFVQTLDRAACIPLRSLDIHCTETQRRGATLMKKLDLLAATLVVVGGLNWGLVAVAKFDLVAAIFGGMDFGETNAASRIVYGLVGLAALYQLARLPSFARASDPAPARS